MRGSFRSKCVRESPSAGSFRFAGDSGTTCKLPYVFAANDRFMAKAA
jgi:hypothetical protein